MRNERVPKENSTAGVIPRSPWRVEKVSLLPDFGIRVHFFDGTSGEVSLKRLVFSDRAGVFAALRDVEVFKKSLWSMVR
jgi:hypothetical protein